MEVLVIKRYSELAEDIKPIAMQNYKDGYCAYTDPNGVTADDIEENKLLFTPDGEIFGEYRICSICGSMMLDGYCYDGGEKYYCTDECLHHDFTDEEWEKEFENNSDYSYWTEWF